MRLLLDTHAFLWWISDDKKLTRRARRAIAEPSNEVLFSAVSAWEIVLKASLGRLDLPEPADFIPEQLDANAFNILPLHLSHALAVDGLPDHHRDPFDRLLVGQALSETIPIVSGDSQVARYPIRVIW